jgi:hypothetical protein
MTLRLTPEQQALITTEHLEAGINVAKAYARKHRLDREECISQVHEALCDAARDFEPSRGVKFTTMAVKYQDTALEAYRTSGSKPAGRKGRQATAPATAMFSEMPTLELLSPQQPRRDEAAEEIERVMSCPVEPQVQALMVGMLATGLCVAQTAELIGMPRYHAYWILKKARRNIINSIGNRLEAK